MMNLQNTQLARGQFQILPTRCEYIQSEMAAYSDAEIAQRMAAYLKTDQPFYGVKAPTRRQILKQALAKFPIQNWQDYHDTVLYFWFLPEREMRYIAIDIAIQNKKFRTEAAWPLYTQLVKQAVWWDDLDIIASNLVGDLWLKYPEKYQYEIMSWLDHPSKWVRRASLLAHLKHKENTNQRLLARSIKKVTNDREFFICKAVGWVLREYAKTDPQWVLEFVEQHGEELSKLSKREALKHMSSTNLH